MQVEINYKDSDADMDRETLAMLGGHTHDDAGGIKIKPITPAVVSLLDLIDSPLITGAELTMLDMYRALYVIQHGESAVAPVLRAHREIEAIETAAAQAVQSPEHYRAYLDALRGTSTGWHEFDAAACRYALSLGNVDFAAIARWMRQALHDGTAGFRMIEPDGVDKPDELAAQKKSMPSESIGCVTWLRRAVRFARRLLRKR